MALCVKARVALPDTSKSAPETHVLEEESRHTGTSCLLTATHSLWRVWHVHTYAHMHTTNQKQTAIHFLKEKKKIPAPCLS